ncbi:glycogen synthase [Methylobacterium sp. Leaf469]|jgi:starch synthase|uniref:glycogen synthase GlgA n=1 Tax=unclassified Methylobacterium TaxID=2615210 RepID=UPI0006FD6AF1|nr:MULTISPECIES: glycogen synthase GlgA [unclassified Methylobacterium]USU33208.1 glycogen synthase GlgA [Methylobacterium sp. OTU13CASTA1]KQP34094.1 glycogen synthase [Methylobacterium sp. Leaf102]KQP36488.1 glycogen synthase [Methylobacterium sp. Leaf100]KQP61989.1 glycogen synthase [Methylobacterium sp. Leaf112]KQU05214.1 glycogen synthase [Methylobacterium sp. Leaf469]
MTSAATAHSASARGLLGQTIPPLHQPRILFATPEMADFVKTGGLGEVAASLPRALRRHYDIRVLIPGYRQVVDRFDHIPVVAQLPGHAGVPPCELGLVESADGLQIYVVLSPELYQRDGTPYGDGQGDFADNDIRFARLSLAAAEIARGVDPAWAADLLHLNDWQAALAPAYLAWSGVRVPSILTVHNLAYQGLFPHESLGRLGVPDHAFQMDGVEFYGQLSFLKAGIYYASHVTTVSDTYAREITTPDAGCGLDGLLRTRASQGRLAGILNGIDESWDPRTDPYLATRFEADDWKGKRANAETVRRQFGLAVSRGPLFAIVSRLVHQKGIDLSLAAADTIVAEGGQLVVIGQGESRFEGALRDLSRRHPDAVGVHVGFNEQDARRMFAGSDFLLMPSRFEPCGLAQMYAQRFGSLPIVHRTGGLADTVEDGVTGFTFGDASARGFSGAIRRALDTFGQKKRLNAMRRTAMSRTFGWDEAATTYASLYARAFGNGAGLRARAA